MKPKKKQEGSEKQVVILLCDMVRYSQITASMRPGEIRDFIVDYHQNLLRIINIGEKQHQRIDPSAGDGAISIFEKREGENQSDLCDRAVSAAINLAFAMEQGNLPQTRIGIFAGDIIEATISGKTMRFGASFSVASRLEELCGYFGTYFLMDKEVAFWQSVEKNTTVSIGKITPKNFDHPIHVYTVYKPGIHNCPIDVDRETLSNFIELKNEAVGLFCGNQLQGNQANFPLAKEKLTQVQDLFVAMTGKKDVASERLLEYIRNTPYPGDEFKNRGMVIRESTEDSLGIRLLHLSNELLRAMDDDFYHTLVVDTEWERRFKLIWKKKGQKIVKIGDPPNGVYYIDTGSVNVINDDGTLITTLTAGNVFGEMAYFSNERVRNATVVANSDVVLRRISGSDFEKLPVVMKIFKQIASRRSKQEE